MSFHWYKSSSWTGIALGCLATISINSQAWAQNINIIPATHGTGTIVEINGQRIDIRGGAYSGDGKNLFHLFREFGLSQSQIANFIANPQLRNILAGVNGGNPSLINGLLQVTGGNANLYLLNPAGIIFGPNAQLNVPAAFTATTATGADFGNGWFSLTGPNNYQSLVGNPIGFAFAGNQAGSIINEGHLQVNPGQSLMLLGGHVINTGNVSAPGGEITVAAVPGQSLVRISQEGQLLSLDIRSPQPGDSLPNQWNLPILSLPELLTGPGTAVVNTVSVNPDGTIRLAHQDLAVTSPTIGIAGAINASSPAHGGSINVLGTNINLIGANLNADGLDGGGNVRIGGEYLGGAGLPTAQFTTIDANSVISASALANGDGGRVIIWSDQTTLFNGEILAKGGLLGGNGGFVETSGKAFLGISGLVNASAPLGTSGTWLLDPVAIEIVSSCISGLGCPAGQIDVASINATLNTGTNLTLITNQTAPPSNSGSPSGGDILQNADARIIHSGAGQPTLSLIASGAITLEGGISGQNLNVSLSAGDPDGGTVNPGLSHQITISAPLNIGSLVTNSDAATEIRADIKTVGNQVYDNLVIIAPDSLDVPPLNLESTSGTLLFRNSLDIGSNLVALVANGFEFNGGSGSVTGPGGTIGLAANGLFAVDQNLMSNFADGFSLIGLASQTSQVQLGSNITVSDPLRILAPQINTQGFNITGIDNASLILQGPGGVTANNLTTSNGLIIVSTSLSETNPTTNLQPGPITVGSVNSGATPLSLLTTGTLATGALDTSSLLTLQGVGGITLGGAVGTSLAPSSLVAVGPITIKDSVTTTGNQIYNGTVTVNATSGTTPENPLEMNSSSGNLTFTDQLDVVFGQSIALLANGFNFNGGPGSVTGFGANLIFRSNSNLVLDQNLFTPFASGFNSIQFAALNPSGQVAFSGNINVSNPLVLSAPEINTNGFSITAPSLNFTSTSPSTILVGGSITTIGDQIFNGNVVLTSATNLLSNSGIITFNGNLNGAFPVSFTGSQFIINGIIGGVTPLASLVAVGTTNLTGSIFTTGNQTYNSTVTTSSTGTSTFQSSSGNLNFSSITTNGGSFNLLAGGSLITGDLNTSNFSGAAGNITLRGATIDTTAGTISASSTTQQGTINIQAPGNINLGNINTRSAGNGANVSIVSQNGIINLLSGMDLGSDNGTGARLSIQAGGDINLAGTVFLDAGTRDAGQIQLTSSGNINGENARLIAAATTNFGLSGTPQGNAGLINATAADNITLGTLEAFAEFGQGGTVTLTGNQIRLGYINAQGGTSGAGGVIEINANTSFQALQSFSDRNSVDASLSTAGGTGNGQIQITLNNDTPLIIGDPSVNGTLAALTTGLDNTVFPSTTFFTSTTDGNVSFINTGVTPQPSPTPEPTPNQPPQDICLTDPTVCNPSPETPTTTTQSELGLFNPPLVSLINRDLPLSVGQAEKLQCEAFSEYFGRALCKQPQSLAEVRGILNNIAKQTGKNPGVIYVLSRPDQVDLLLVTAGAEPILRTVPGVTREALLKQTQAFSDQVRDPRFIGTNAYLRSSQALYNTLIRPLESDLQAQKIDTLLFSMDAGLRTVPLAALHNGTNFLVENYAIGLIPSMSLINPTYRDIRQDRILAMGAETFPDLSPLPAVPVELATITSDLGGGIQFLNQNFTVRKLESERRLEDFGVVHLATHGEFNPGSPRDSFIAFSDRRVTLAELPKLRLNLPTTELLTLSACRTAVGNEQAELGFAGMAIQSGIKSALASLWYVSDEGTLGLMTEFYQQLNTAPIKAEALRQAQIAMINGQVKIEDGQLISANRPAPIKLPPALEKAPNRTLNHPYFWAAFTMIGSPW